MCTPPGTVALMAGHVEFFTAQLASPPFEFREMRAPVACVGPLDSASASRTSRATTDAETTHQRSHDTKPDTARSYLVSENRSLEAS